MLQITTSRGSPSHLLWRPPFHQDHSVSAWHNKFGTFQVKIEQKTETRTRTQKTKRTTVGDEMPTAGQRAVHFRTLAIVAAACRLQVPVSYPRWMLHLHTSFGTRLDLLPHLRAHCFTAFHPGLLTTPLHLAGSHACRHHGHQHHQPVDLVQPKLDGPNSPV